MPRFKACSSAHTIRKRCVWTQILLNTEKIISVFENTRLRVDGQIYDSKTLRVDAGFFFKYGRGLSYTAALLIVSQHYVNFALKIIAADVSEI